MAAATIVLDDGDPIRCFQMILHGVRKNLEPHTPNHLEIVLALCAVLDTVAWNLRLLKAAETGMLRQE